MAISLTVSAGEHAARFSPSSLLQSVNGQAEQITSHHVGHIRHRHMISAGEPISRASATARATSAALARGRALGQQGGTHATDQTSNCHCSRCSRPGECGTRGGWLRPGLSSWAVWALPSEPRTRSRCRRAKDWGFLPGTWLVVWRPLLGQSVSLARWLALPLTVRMCGSLGDLPGVTSRSPEHPEGRHPHASALAVTTKAAI